MKKKRTLVLGDVHGGLKALEQVFERCELDFKNDTVICLGDVADGWPDVAECFELLFKIKHLIYIRGNHDQWLKDWLKDERKTPLVWTYQGGQNTIESYKKYPELKKKHLNFLKKTKFYYRDKKNRIFVHGGVDLYDEKKLKDKMFLSWDRTLWLSRYNLDNFAKNLFKEVYVGHTDIYSVSHRPLQFGNVWFMDTGGGWAGYLSIMDIDTKKIWSSDNILELYPRNLGRI